MYKISVPVMNCNIKRNDRECLLQELKRFDTERVFLALDTYELDEAKRKKALEELADNCRFFKERGFEVGTWIWTFWLRDGHAFKNMRAINGEEIKEFVCPTDETFVEFATEYMKEVAQCGVDLIMFDDDFRYGFLADQPACLCDNHIAEINRITGGNLTREALEQKITCGGPNIYRNAYIQANADAFRKFATAVRTAIDTVDPKIRVGICACMSSWDIDGTNAAELTTILAGSTQPFARLIGAPYWAVKNGWGNALQDVIELERMESAWTRAEGIEIMAEGDAYPRPRTLCPASYLEGFDTAIRASGCTDGILKYGIDYWSNADYETGYAAYHERNRELYKQIEAYFRDKTHVGVRVYESMTKVADMVMPTKVNKEVNIQDLFFSKAARTLAYNTIPTVYAGEGVCGIVFDENARKLPLDALKNGLILDLAAAEILMARGIDVGIEEIGEATGGNTERFLKNNNHILTNDAIIYDLRLNASAEVLSDAETPVGTVPVSFRYENKNGNRFLILNVNTRSGADSILKNYERSRQYAQQIPWLSGKTLPACAYGNPALYMQCKQGGGAMAVGLWNFFADSALAPVITLDKPYTQITFINCDGRLDRDKVYLADIPPFGFAGFEVK